MHSNQNTSLMKYHHTHSGYIKPNFEFILNPMAVCLIPEIKTYLKNVYNDNALSLFHFLCGDACWDFFDQHRVSGQLTP